MLHQTPEAKGTAPVIGQHLAGAVCSQAFTYDFGTAYTTASDKIELGYLPASAKLRGARLVSSGLTSTITVGVLAGEAGKNDDTRALTADLFSAVAVNGEHTTTLAKALAVTADENADKAIGATVAADVAAGAGSITLVIDYVF